MQSRSATNSPVFSADLTRDFLQSPAGHQLLQQQQLPPVPAPVVHCTAKQVALHQYMSQCLHSSKGQAYRATRFATDSSIEDGSVAPPSSWMITLQVVLSVVYLLPAPPPNDDDLARTELTSFCSLLLDHYLSLKLNSDLSKFSLCQLGTAWDTLSFLSVGLFTVKPIFLLLFSKGVC